MKGREEISQHRRLACAINQAGTESRPTRGMEEISGAVPGRPVSGINTIDEPREGNSLSHMVQAAEPGH
jgi:hypothetical protein